MPFMPLSSKTWTHLEYFQDLADQVRKSFFQDLVFQVLKCTFFATPCPQVWTMTALFKTWLSKSWNFSGQRISTSDPCHELCLSWLGLPRHEHKWTWLSRLGSHNRSEILHFSFKTWQYPMSWTVTFCTSMSPRLDNDCPIQDLAFQVLKLSGKDFQH